jgi:hypothetical protein
MINVFFNVSFLVIEDNVKLRKQTDVRHSCYIH